MNNKETVKMKTVFPNERKKKFAGYTLGFKDSFFEFKMIKEC